MNDGSTDLKKINDVKHLTLRLNKKTRNKWRNTCNEIL